MITEVRSDAVIKENEFETFTDLKEKIRKMCNGKQVGEDDENLPSKDDSETGKQRINGDVDADRGDERGAGGGDERGVDIDIE